MRSRTIPIHPVASPEHGGSCEGAEPFALMVLGDSMQPEFHDGDIVVIEPDGLVRDGNYVLAHSLGEWTLRQLLRTGDRWFLQPLNPVYPTIGLDDLSCIRGVVVQRSRPQQRHATKCYVDQ